MAPHFGIQPSFSGGVFAPSLWSRVDLQKYSTGLKTGKNAIVHPHGGASNRPGTRYIATTKTSGKKVRLVPFEFSTQQAYIIEFGHNYCRFYMNQGQILSGGPYEISTTYTESELADLHFTQSADTLYITHPDHAPATLSRLGHTNWVLAAYDFKDGPYMQMNAIAANKLTPSGTTGSITLTSNVAISAVDHVGALFRIEHDIEGQAQSGSITGTGTKTALKSHGTWRLNTSGIWNATLSIEKSLDG